MEEKIIKNYDINSWKEVILVYRSALKQIETKLDILNEEFQHVHNYNPIEHVKVRLKTAESIVKKLKKYGYESNIVNMVKYINDIAGVRIICSFSSDIYRLAQIIREQKDIEVVSIKDYITYPKKSGYRSYHMIITVPVYLTEKTIRAKVEIQIRTVAMDFWASLEHKIHYKFEGNVPSDFQEQLLDCSKLISDMEEKMLALNEVVHQLNDSKNEECPSN